MTIFELLKNVDFDNTYEHVIDFENVEAQEEYFDNKVEMSFEDFSIVRPNSEIIIEANFNSIYNLNYCRFTNTLNNVLKTYYAFITMKEHVGNDRVRLHLEIDVFQSYMFDFSLKESFVSREHQNRFDNTGKMLFNREVENVDVGSDYDITSKTKLKDSTSAIDDIVWIEVVATEPISTGSYLTADPTTWGNLGTPTSLNQKGVPTNLYVYLYPIIFGSTGIPFYTVNGERNIVLISSNEYLFLIKSTAVISCRVLQYCPVKHTIETYLTGYLIKFASGYVVGETGDRLTVRLATANNTNFGGVDLSGIGTHNINLMGLTPDNANETFVDTISPLAIDIANLSINNLKNIAYEPKLRTAPYEYIQITDNQSEPLKIKNENIDGTKNIKFIQSLGAQSKTKIYVDNYNGDNGKFSNSINNTISELPLINDAYIAYLAQNKANATTGVALNIAGGIASLGLGLLTGGIGLIAGVGGAMSIGGRVADDLIKKQDLQDTPDSIRKQGNNAEFDISDNNLKFEKSILKIKSYYASRLFNYLYFYGYQANYFTTPNTRSRYYFNYIKTTGLNLTSNLDNDIIKAIKQIFQNGVTIWHFRDATTFKGLYNYDYENVEMSLIGV